MQNEPVGFPSPRILELGWRKASLGWPLQQRKFRVKNTVLTVQARDSGTGWMRWEKQRWQAVGKYQCPQWPLILSSSSSWGCWLLWDTCVSLQSSSLMGFCYLQPTRKGSTKKGANRDQPSLWTLAKGHAGRSLDWDPVSPFTLPSLPRSP